MPEELFFGWFGVKFYEDVKQYKQNAFSKQHAEQQAFQDIREGDIKRVVQNV